MNNNIFRHIEYLMLSHDCVIVPGLGAFIAISRPAVIDYDSMKITPPSRSIVFNHAVTSDDGLLANSLVRKHGITFDEARQILLREANLIKETLANGKVMAAGSLGVLSMGSEGNLIFNPSEEISSINDKLGYSDIAIPTDKSQNLAEDETDDSNTDYYHLRVSKTLMRIAAVLAVMLAVGVAFILNPIPTDDREQRASVMPVEAILQNHIADKGPEVVKDTTGDISTPENNQIEKTIPSHYLIVATFSSEKEAEKYVASNSSAECPMIMVKSRKMTRISIAESDDREILRRQLNSRDVLSRFPNAWIWTRN